MSIIFYLSAAIAGPFEGCDSGRLKDCEAIQADLMRRAATLARHGVDVPSVLRQPLLWATLQADLVSGRAQVDDPRCAVVPAPNCSEPAASTPDAFSPSKLRAISTPPPFRSRLPRTWTVEGIVRWPDGSPAVDVAVELFDDIGTSGFSGRDLVDFLRHPYPSHLTRTDEQGHYLFEAVGGKAPSVVTVHHPGGWGGSRYNPDGTGDYAVGDVTLKQTERLVDVRLPDGSPAKGARILGQQGSGRTDGSGRLHLGASSMKMESLIVSSDGAWIGWIGGDDADVTLKKRSPRCRWRYPNGDEARPEEDCGALLVSDVDTRWRHLEWQVEHDGHLGAIVREPAATDCKMLPWEPGLRVRQWRLLGPQGEYLHPNLCTKRTTSVPSELRLEAVVPSQAGVGWDLLYGDLKVQGDEAVFVSTPTRKPVPMETRRYVLADGTPLVGLGVRVSDDLGKRHRQVFTDVKGRVEVPVDLHGHALADLPRRDNGAVGVYPPVRRMGAHHEVHPLQREPLNLGGTEPDVVVGRFPPIQGAPAGVRWLDPVRKHLGIEGDETLVTKGLVRVHDEMGTLSLLAWAGPGRVLRFDVGKRSPFGAAHLVTSEGRASPWGLKSVGSPNYGSARPHRRDSLAIAVQCQTSESCADTAREVGSRFASWPPNVAAVLLAERPIPDHHAFAARLSKGPGADWVPWEVIGSARTLPQNETSRVFVLVDGIPRWGGEPADLTIEVVESLSP